LSIKNYRSLEEVRLDRLDRFNVLIGRNNSGKSSVFSALQLLNPTTWTETVELDRVLTDMDETRSMELQLTFKPRHEDRAEFIDLVAATEPQKGRRDDMLKSPLLREVEFTFRAPEGKPELLHLRQTRIRTEDNVWAVVQSMKGGEREATPNSIVTNTDGYGDYYSHAVVLNQDLLDVIRITESGMQFQATADMRNVMSREAHGMPPPSLPASTWPQRRLAKYLGDAFFFDPFRHSEENEAAQEASELAQDGSNLAQVLFTLHNNNGPKFDEIEAFVQAALPDVGSLETPVESSVTRVSFGRPGGYMVRLHDMGGGIEQLLMAATVLLTTGDESTVFLEEPESHLHAGAQRYLIERLYTGDRQVFVATHSPTFVNLSRQRSLYQITYAGGRTTIDRLSDADALGDMLEDIGARNSDVLLSDAVMFVEGPSDRGVFFAWSETLGRSLEESNVTVLPMGGGEVAEGKARVRSEILEGISKRAPVPHLLVLDRDERNLDEIHALQRDLGDKVELLEQREIENYLMVPRALLEAIRKKHVDDASILERIKETSIDEVQDLIETTTDSLYGVVLLKRIRAALEGLKGGLFPRELAIEMAPSARRKDLPRLLRSKMTTRVKDYLGNVDLDALVAAEREALSREWSDSEKRLYLAPGEEILAAVFNHFGSEYKKPGDTVRIAREMSAVEIPDEIQALIDKVVALPGAKWK
jgi:predicted ATPase